MQAVVDRLIHAFISRQPASTDEAKNRSCDDPAELAVALLEKYQARLERRAHAVRH